MWRQHSGQAARWGKFFRLTHACLPARASECDRGCAMTRDEEATLIELAARYVWWQPPEQTLARRHHFLCQR